MWSSIKGTYYFACCIYNYTCSYELSNVYQHRDFSRVSRLRTIETSHSRKHHFVTSDWATDSIECEVLKNERIYEPNICN